MKARINITHSEARRIAEEAAKQQMENLRTECYKQAYIDVAEQFTAWHCYVLAKSFGFGEKRLKRFLNSVKEVNRLMLEDKLLGEAVSTSQLVNHLQKIYNIDLSIPDKVEFIDEEVDTKE